MVLLLVRALTFLCSAAVGLLVASLLVPGFSLRLGGLLTTVVVFAVIQSLLAPLIGAVAKRHASSFLGGVGIVATLVGLLVAARFTHGLQISSAGAWLAATVLVWLVTALATVLLPLVLFRKTVKRRQEARRG